MLTHPCRMIYIYPRIGTRTYMLYTYINTRRTHTDDILYAHVKDVYHSDGRVIAFAAPEMEDSQLSYHAIGFGTPFFIREAGGFGFVMFLWDSTLQASKRLHTSKHQTKSHLFKVVPWDIYDKIIPLSSNTSVFQDFCFDKDISIGFGCDPPGFEWYKFRFSSGCPENMRILVVTFNPVKSATPDITKPSEVITSVVLNAPPCREVLDQFGHQRWNGSNVLSLLQRYSQVPWVKISKISSDYSGLEVVICQVILLIGSLCHYLQGFRIYPGWLFGISERFLNHQQCNFNEVSRELDVIFFLRNNFQFYFWEA